MCDSPFPDTGDSVDSYLYIPLAFWLSNITGTPPTPPSMAQDSTTPSGLEFPTVLPSFTPLFLDPSRCSSQGKPNPSTLRNKHRQNPIGIFKIFVTTEVIRTIADSTNLYAKDKNAGNGSEWVQCLLGICLYMGVFNCPKVEDY